MRFCNVTVGLLILVAVIAAQTAQTNNPSSGASGLTAAAGPPAYVLYRLFFRHIAASQTQASKLDAAGKAGGADLRNEYRKSLFLNASQASLLIQSAQACNASLDQQHANALPTIAAARAALAAAPAGTPKTPSVSLLETLASLEQARTNISNQCIANLHVALGDRMFSNVDVFVKTKFAQKVSKVTPSWAVPPTRLAAAAPVAAGGSK